MKFLVKLLAPLLALALTLAPASSQFSGDGKGFRISPGLQGQGDGRTTPANTVAPAISGATTVGNILTTTDGTWTGIPTPTFTYQWNRNGSAIGSANASTYTLVSADNGTTTTVTVTATNTAGITSATSSGVGPITDPAGDFIARTSGLDATHQNAFTALINGLVADGVWSKLDVLRIYATQGSANALLNLVSTSYNGTLNGSPTFTTDRGFTGTEASSSIYIDSGFNPSTASSPKYSLNSAHLSMWSINNTACNPPVGYAGPSNTVVSYIFKNSGDNNIYLRPNSSGTSGGAIGVFSVAGHWIANRNGNTTGQAYQNGSSQYNGGLFAAGAIQNLKFYELAYNANGTAAGSGNQYAAISYGASLSSTDASNFYTRLRTYMTVVGVP